MRCEFRCANNAYVFTVHFRSVHIALKMLSPLISGHFVIMQLVASQLQPGLTMRVLSSWYASQEPATGYIAREQILGEAATPSLYLMQVT